MTSSWLVASCRVTSHDRIYKWHLTDYIEDMCKIEDKKFLTGAIFELCTFYVVWDLPTPPRVHTPEVCTPLNVGLIVNCPSHADQQLVWTRRDMDLEVPVNGRQLRRVPSRMRRNLSLSFIRNYQVWRNFLYNSKIDYFKYFFFFIHFCSKNQTFLLYFLHNFSIKPYVSTNQRTPKGPE